MAKKARAAGGQAGGGPRHGGSEHGGGGHGGGGHHGGTGTHHPHGEPYEDPDYDCRPPPHHPHEPPVNPRYPDERIYGTYASKKPPVYVPHPFEHTCFKPRKEDYKPPITCDEPDSDLCVRKDHRALTTDEQTRFLNAFTQVNAMGAFGPLVDIHSNALHQMHSNPRFLPWHRIYLLRFEELLMMADPTVCIPYWKSSEEQAFPAWLLPFTPTVTLARDRTRSPEHRRSRDAAERGQRGGGTRQRDVQPVRFAARGRSQLRARLGGRLDAEHPHGTVRPGLLDAPRGD